MKRLGVVLVLVAACGKGPSEGQCKQLMDHLIDLEFKKAGVNATTEEQKGNLAKQRATVVEAKQADFMAVCVDKTARDRVECAIAATDLEAVAKCDSN
jgi:hypothetical protein